MLGRTDWPYSAEPPAAERQSRSVLEFHPHELKRAGEASSETAGGAVLPELRRRGRRPANLRRLLRRDLSALRHSARISRRVRNGLTARVRFEIRIRACL